MARGTLPYLLLWCVAAMFAVSASPAVAQSAPLAASCHATGGKDTSYAEVMAEPQRWVCSQRDWSIAAPRAFLRYDFGQGVEPAQLRFETRLTRFSSLRLTLIGTDGRTASREVGQDEMRLATSDWIMGTSLPRLDGTARSLIVRIDDSRHAGMLSDARLVSSVGSSEASIRIELLIAGLLGILCVPLVFNLAFYRILRQRFLLWHTAAVLFMLVQTFVTSGLINRFVGLTVDELCILSAFSWAGGIAAAALFSADFIERGKLDPLHRGLLRCLALWIPAWTAFYLFADGSLRPLAPQLYFASFLPVLGLFIWIMAVAKLRGSRAVNFQIVAWTPLMITGAVRIASALGVTDAPLEMQLEQHFSIVFEIIVNSLGVADRFLVIRRQRDRAWAQARQLEERAERDPLTGLLNRRGLTARFGDFLEEGFRTMAVIDMDHFKQINDNYGHSVGDDVLRAVAEALAPDENTLAVRMGGEEFLLLLRGKDSAARAERRRQAISARIADMVPGLNRVVTASMGLVEYASGALHGDFPALYAHCDRLLYEAKAAGRNRTMSEKVMGFSAHPAISEAAA